MPYTNEDGKNRAIFVSLVLVVTIALSIFIPQAVTTNSWASSSSSFTTPDGGGSWLTGWNYRKMITVAGSTNGAQTNYQMKLTINRSTGADSGSNVYVGTKCASDYRDIRLTKADGTTPLDYWIESSTSSSATVWIEFDSIPAYPNNGSFYLYYGYASASAASSGANTFLLFDDFLGTAIGTIWTQNGSPSVSGSILILSGSICGIKSKTAYGYRRFRSLINFLSDTHTGYRNWAGFKDNFNQAAEETTQFAPVGGSPTSMYSQNYHSAWDSVNGGAGNVDAYKTFQIDRLSSSSIKYYISDSLLRSTVIQIPTSALYVMFMCGNAATTNYNQPFYVDWVFVANLTANEPTWGAWGSEEINLSPTVTNEGMASSVTNTTKTSAKPPNILLIIIILCVIVLLVLLFIFSASKSSMAKPRKSRVKKRSQLVGLILIAAITLIGGWLFDTSFGKFLLIFMVCLLLVFGIFKITKFVLRHQRRWIRLRFFIQNIFRRYGKYPSKERLINMGGTEFEYYVEELSKKQGWTAKRLGGPGDRGIDLIAERAEKLYGKTEMYIQCKNHGTPATGNSVRNLNGALPHNKAGVKGVLICPSGFTQQAEDEANDHKIALWDYQDICNLIKPSES